MKKRDLRIEPTGRFLKTSGGVTEIYRLLPYKCPVCQKLIDGELSGDYLGLPAAQNALEAASSQPCFNCSWREAQARRNKE